MKDFRIALVAQHSRLNHVAENVAASEQWIRKAARRQAQLVVLPELNLTGHGGDASMIRPAEPLPDGPICRRMIELARECRIHVCAGIAEREGPNVYNAQFLVGPDGFIGKQRKVHLSCDEYFHFRHGTAMPVFALPFAAVGMVICFDNHFPEVARCLALQGAEVLLCPHAGRGGFKRALTPSYRRGWVRQHKENWRMLHYSRAVDNRVYVALCNAVGEAAAGIKGVQARHAGGCMVLDPLGQVAGETRAKDIAEEMVIADLSADTLRRPRESVSFNLRARRPEAYGVLTRPTA